MPVHDWDAMQLLQHVTLDANRGQMFRTCALLYALVMADVKTADTYATSQMRIHFVRCTTEALVSWNGRQMPKNSLTRSPGQAGQCLT